MHGNETYIKICYIWGINLYKITSTYSKEVQQILNEFDEIVSKRAHDIRNCQTIEHAIRLITDIPVIGKMKYYIPKEYK